MTLNITLSSRWKIFQTSDFRLTAGPHNPVKENSQKQFVIQYPTWSGVLSYTGVAQYGNHWTDEWLTQVLTHDEIRTVNQVVKVLQGAGTWLAGVPEKDRRHTFTLVGFSDKPFVRVISNCERYDQPFALSPTLHVSSYRPGAPHCFATGTTVALTAAWRTELEEMLTDGADDEAIIKRMAAVSRDVATSGLSQGYIGEVVSSAMIRSDTTGLARIFGSFTGNDDYRPTMITMGRDVGSDIEAALLQEGLTEGARVRILQWGKAPGKNSHGFPAPEMHHVFFSARPQSLDTDPGW